MSESFYTARARLEVVGPLHRRARLASGETFDLGVHGPVVKLFQLQPPRELPLPVDYIVAATGGWMLGTLVGALEARQVRIERGDLETDVEGVHEIRDGLPVLTEVRLRYRMRIPVGTREKVDKALGRHLERCPTANSLKGAVLVSWTAEIEEAG